MLFLVQTPHPWRGIRQRAHHLMTRFAAQGHQVHWVESRYLRWLVDRPSDFLRARAESPLANLDVRPLTLVNGERLAPVRALNQRRLARAVSEPLKKATAPAGPVVLWIYNPHEGHLADSVPHDLLIYDIMDEYRGFPWSPPNIESEEAALLRRADWVFAGTGALFDAKRPLAEGRIECILSGVESERFARPARALPHPDQKYQAWRARYPFVVGYAGMIDLRIDLPLLAALAAGAPEVGLVLVGPAVSDISALDRFPNIFLAGPRPYGELPHWYHSWDAALLPFLDNELTRHVNPTKMLEYAGADLPILARALPEIERFYADGSWLYRTTEEFQSALAAVRSGPADARASRLENARAWARARHWDTLAAQMLTRLGELQKRA